MPSKRAVMNEWAKDTESRIHDILDQKRGLGPDYLDYYGCSMSKDDLSRFKMYIDDKEKSRKFLVRRRSVSFSI